VAQSPGDLGALERADREAAMEDWLAAHGVADAWELAPQLVAAGLDAAKLVPIAAALERDALAATLGWLGALLPVYTLAYEIGQGSARISEIVGAMKSYAHLGQAPILDVDLHAGIDNTLVILRSKLKQGIAVRREFASDLPPIPAFGSELNQVWTNILDNAADALGGSGNITIRTRRNGAWAVVEIEDDGPGIPEEIQAHIFDPFFTTKEPGKGTGLGLSTTYSIVTEKHKGEIAVQSRPGSTRFTIKLPIGQPSADVPS
jgi:signal transduction histidine kinase